MLYARVIQLGQAPSHGEDNLRDNKSANCDDMMVFSTLPIVTRKLQAQRPHEVEAQITVFVTTLEAFLNGRVWYTWLSVVRHSSVRDMDSSLGLSSSGFSCAWWDPVRGDLLTSWST